MKTGVIFILVPLAGYAGLWLLASLLFLLYFKGFGVRLDLGDALGMIRKLPPVLAVTTVPVCSLISFFAASRLLLEASSLRPGTGYLFLLGAAALAFTIVLDLLITVAGEKIDILAFPLNLMYLFAWLVIIPAVIWGGR